MISQRTTRPNKALQTHIGARGLWRGYVTFAPLAAEVQSRWADGDNELQKSVE